MARKKKRTRRGGPKVSSTDMFGTTTRQVLQVRPVPRSRGGGGRGDEAVVLTYRKQGRKRNRGSVQVIKVDDLPEGLR